MLVVPVREADTYHWDILAHPKEGAAELQVQQQQMSVQAVSVNQSLQASCKHPAICHVTDNDSRSALFVRRPLTLGSRIWTLLATRRAGTCVD